MSCQLEGSKVQTVLRIESPYLVFIGDIVDPLNAKTGFGLVQWCTERVAGQLRLPGCPVDLGVSDLSVEDAAAAGVRSLIIGVAPPGGTMPGEWWAVVEDAASRGMDIVSGLHVRLGDNPVLVRTARRSGARLIDVRVPPQNLPVGTGRRRRGKRLLTVGTDCAVGKKYAALSLTRSMQDAGLHATFRATGQTGIMIAGAGIPIDSVVSDFVSGAAEMISPDNDDDHWDIVEGQGSLFHPGYAAVSLGLLHGSQPDAIVVCHQAGRREINSWPGFELPSIATCLERNLLEGRTTNPRIRCVGICVNTSALDVGARSDYLKALTYELQLPCIDPLVDGCARIVEYLHLSQKRTG